MKLLHFLAVVIIFVLTIFIVLVVYRPRKGCPDPKPKCQSDQVAICYDNEWKCVKNVPGMCREDKKPICVSDPNNSTNSGLTCINGEWHCNFYSAYKSGASESCYPVNMPTYTGFNATSFSDAEQICIDEGTDCNYFTYNQTGYKNYSPMGAEDNNIISGMRLTPYSSNIFKRYNGYDMSDVFYGDPKYGINKYTQNNVKSVYACENFCVNADSCIYGNDTCSCVSGGFGYVYNKQTRECNVYSANNTNGTGKYIKDPIQY